jgi:HSP20 family molecular chaperone IbpA
LARHVDCSPIASMAILSIHRDRTGFMADEAYRAATDPGWWDPFAEPSEPEILSPPLDFIPRFDVCETDESIIVRADLPGVHEADVDLTLTEGRLVISGKREPESGESSGTYYSCERSYGSFARTFYLPEGIDADQCFAELNEGVLHLVIPKRAPSSARSMQTD